MLIHRSALVLLAVGASHWLARTFGGWEALAIWSIATGIGCMLGTVLVRTSTVGRVTWKNRVAGYLIPWGGRMNRGRLWPLSVVSWVVWVLLGGATVLVSSVPEQDPPVGDVWPVLLLTAWVVDGGAFLYVLGTMIQHSLWGPRGGRTLVKILAAILLIVVGSFLLFLRGQIRMAVLIAGGPPLVLGTVFGLFVGSLILFGRHSRWN